MSNKGIVLRCGGGASLIRRWLARFASFRAEPSGLWSDQIGQQPLPRRIAHNKQNGNQALCDLRNCRCLTGILLQLADHQFPDRSRKTRGCPPRIVLPQPQCRIHTQPTRGFKLPRRRTMRPRCITMPHSQNQGRGLKVGSGPELHCLISADASRCKDKGKSSGTYTKQRPPRRSAGVAFARSTP